MSGPWGAVRKNILAQGKKKWLDLDGGSFKKIFPKAREKGLTPRGGGLS